ncbi:MAG: M48 family metallopeptidase [Gammaproteobacteria bacterium]|jgi:predicted Zn-dependent protease|nr:M48 family metallopeptidase [Gammaproteobacteria bacterium]MBT3860198.1 M48 family metallopeptidase [Gammaproteobacteria bacterium]MBT3987490.1 M48 family metallopeptidase [Gammaproteobacteria bacterium]MBT4255336.1 M48 family metallopeptidase [Gammaproteobacteria bacterium]MBT4581772.1 M48 family metallopeptidase [Gammaproteobacteria bacterium]
MRSTLLLKFSFSLGAIMLASCVSSPMDRRQVMLYSEAEMAAQGEQSYRQMQTEIPISDNAREKQFVQCVANYVVNALDPGPRNNNEWEVTVFDNEQANAFALPGGKIGVYNGLLSVTWNQHQLAAVMAHEVGHVLANHSNERASQSTLRNVGVAAAQILGASETTIEILDVGTKYGLFLPFNRTQETEADSIGIMLMANAGFDPEESIKLWQNMSAEGGARPPELLSTHPSPSSRMGELASLMDHANGLRLAANNSGVNPDCTP